MRTEFTFHKEHLNVDINKLYAADLNDEELAMIKHFVELTRHIQEIDGIFQIFRFNIMNMRHQYTLFSSGNIERNIEYDFNTSDSVAINALTISFISAGKTLIESIENFLKMQNTKIYQDFKENCLAKEYDANFHYRLLLRLRDYAQHGHLPVTMDYDNKYCFDINHILSNPHFNLNSSIKKQMKDIRVDILEKYSDYPFISLTLSLAEFNICIIRVYLGFLKKIRGLLHGSVDNVKSLLNSRPEIINKSPKIFDGYVFYEAIDNTLHSFDSNQNPKAMLAQYKNIASEIMRDEQPELDRIKSGFKFV